MPNAIRSLLAAALVLLLAPADGAADAQQGSLDDFSAAHGWVGHSESIPCGSCGPPFHLCLCPPASQQQGVSTELGGPAGALDAYLRLAALPSFGVVSWNRAADRSGDYNGAGIDALALDLRNFGGSPLVVRVGLERGATRWVSSDTAAVALPASSGWLTADFAFAESEMTRVAGSDSLAFVLDDVDEIRLLHAPTAQWAGASGPNLGVDNVEWLPEPVGAVGLALGAALTLALRRRRR